MEQLTIRPVPGPGFVATLLTTAWVDFTEGAGDVAWLFVAHAGPRRNGETTETIETNLMGMVDALGLAPATENLPDTGGRVIIRAGSAALYYGHPTTVLRLPRTPRPWMAHVVLGGPTVIALGLDPIPPGAGRDAIEDYLHRSGEAGRVYTGATSLRRRWT